MKLVLKEILKAIIPSMLSTLFVGIYVIVDGFFIGQKLGGIGLAAINVAWPIAGLISVTGTAIGTGAGIIITLNRAKGNNDPRKVLTNMCITLVVASLILMTILFYEEPLLYLIGASSDTIKLAKDYLTTYLLVSMIQVFGFAVSPILRNFNHYKEAALFSIISVFVNFLLDYLLIYLLPLQLVGAALASVLSQVVVLVLGVIYLIKKKELAFCKDIDFKLMLNILRHGVAPFILTYSGSVLIIVYNLYAKKFGGDYAIAAYTVSAYILYVAQYIAIGISDGIQPTLTYHYGLNDNKERKYFYYTLAILLSILGFITIIFLFLKVLFARMFDLNPSEAEIFYQSYYYFVLSFIFVGIIRIYAARLYSTNKRYRADFIVILEPIITPLILLLFTNLFELNGVWIGYLVIQILLSIISCLIILIKPKQKVVE